MLFEPLYYAEKLHVVNPRGDTGIATLWSPIVTILNKLATIAPALLDQERSRIAIIGNLYGDGMMHMFCNLLNNPQIRFLVAMGEEMRLPSCDEIEALLASGLEDGSILGRNLKRIKGTTRILNPPSGFDENRLREQIQFTRLGKLSQRDFADRLTAYFAALPPQLPARMRRMPLKIVEPSASDFAYLPSDPAGHQVIRKSALQCWEELVFRVDRFGRPVTLRKGVRVELLNAKAIIEEPTPDPPAALSAYGFDVNRFAEYQRKILDPELPDDISYTYGNRLRGYYKLRSGQKDTLQVVVQRLMADRESRHCYISLWDTEDDFSEVDADGGEEDPSVPCLTTLFFRIFEGRLTLTATYRSHNLLTAWLENVYGLMSIQTHVAKAIGVPVGPITVISHSLTLNPKEARFPIVESVKEARKKDDDWDKQRTKLVLREDPHGYFAVTVDPRARKIVAEHKHQNVVINRYVAETAREVEDAIARDIAVSLTSHALWLGRELARAEHKLSASNSARSS